MPIERVSSGIKKLDKLIEGGFVKGSSNLIAGGAGCGKTLMCAQFLWDGLKNGENCMFITLEERPEDIIGDAAVFGWNFDSYIKKGKLIIEYKDPFQVSDIVAPLIEKIKANKINRVVVDSTSTMGLYFKDEFEVRKQLFKLLIAIKTTGATSLLTAEIVENGHKASRFGVEEFTTDGVIILNSMSLGKESTKMLEVKKMRRTNIDGGNHTFEFKRDGIDLID